MSFIVVTCNVLADTYIRRDWYPNTPDAWLTPAVRHPALATHLATLDADVLCLQEVERPMYATLLTALAPLGYESDLVLKGNGRPDGCATFWRSTRFAHLGSERIEYADGAIDRPPSGHIAQLTLLQDGARRLGIANTHIKWDAPKAKPEKRYSMAQVTGLIAACMAAVPVNAGWIICGDFNATPDSTVVAAMLDAGYAYAHRGHPDAHTAAPNQAPRVIDYLFHNAALAANAIAPPVIDAQTALPGPDHPSDHLALSAGFHWA